MPYTPALSFYLGPLAVYTSPTGMTDPITGIPYLGGTLHEGDTVDATLSEISQWNVRFGAKLNTGRYRLVRVSPNATAADIAYGKPVGWALPTTVGQVAISAAGTGSGSGTVAVSSSTSGGTAAATALVTVASGVITGVQLVYAGAGFTSVPTFGLTELTAAGITSSGTIVAQMDVNPNVVSSLDGTTNIGGSIYLPRGIALTSLTSAQVTANAWIVIQELGIAPALVTTATQAVAGDIAYATSGGGITTITPAYQATALGNLLDASVANMVSRINLTLPVVQG